MEEEPVARRRQGSGEASVARATTACTNDFSIHGAQKEGHLTEDGLSLIRRSLLNKTYFGGFTANENMIWRLVRQSLT